MLMVHMMIAINVITFLAPASAWLWRGSGSLKDISTALLVMEHTAAAASLFLSVLESYLASDNKLPCKISSMISWMLDIISQ